MDAKADPVRLPWLWRRLDVVIAAPVCLLLRGILLRRLLHARQDLEQTLQGQGVHLQQGGKLRRRRCLLQLTQQLQRRLQLLSLVGGLAAENWIINPDQVPDKLGRRWRRSPPLALLLRARPGD